MYSLCIKDKRAKSQIRQIVSSPLHLQTMTSERTGAIQLPKGEQHLWKLHWETVSHVFRVQSKPVSLDGVE